MYEFILLSICVIVLVTFLFIQQKDKKFKLPPGPKGYPFFGNSFDVNYNNLHLKLDEWAKEYGDIFQVNIFGRNLIVLNTGDINRDALLEEPNATILADRIPGMVGKDFYYDFHDIAFAGQTKETIKRRKLGYRLIHAYGEGMIKIEKCIQEELQTIIKLVDNSGSSTFDAEDLVDRFVCGVLITLIIGRRYDVNSELITTMCVLNHQLSLMLGAGCEFLLHWCPFIKHIPCKVSTDYHKTKWAQEKFFKLLQQEMVSHPDGEGIFYSLFEAKQTELDKDGKPWITDSDIFGITTNIVNAAFVTTKGALLSFIRCIMSFPEVQKNLQDEVDEVVEHNQKPALAHKNLMPYTEAVISETLRLISHVPLSIPHGVLRDTNLRGYDIPKGTTLISNLWSVHHDEKVWKSPYEFNPDRFLDSKGNLLSHESEAMKNLMPFGLGKRSCIGEVFGKGRLFLFVSTMMKYFSFYPDDDTALSPFDPRDLRPGIVLIPVGFKCKIIQREK